jgi:hypothetical protein
VPFKLFLNLLVPTSPGIQGDLVSAIVLDANGNVLLILKVTSITAIVTIPLIKEQFFGKPVRKLFLEFLGLILTLGSIMVLYVMLLNPEIRRIDRINP